MTTLARWRAAKDGATQPERQSRPFLATECDDLRQAERWRNQIISEVARKVAQIQNAGLGEFRIRDMNDEINKLLREKGHWEVRIRELGGQDHSAGGPKLFGTDGAEIPGNRGYMYFGAAKELPGVRELFDQEPAAPPRRTRADLMKHVDADYYGYRDDDDGILVPLEQKLEREAIRRLIKKHKEKMKQKRAKEARTAAAAAVTAGAGAGTGADTGADTSSGACTGTDESEEQGDEKEVTKDNINDEEMEEDDDDMNFMDLEIECYGGSDERSEVLRYMAHVPNIPSQQQVEDALLERKKKELLRQILGDDA